MGSILAITDSSGNIVEQRQFGAWGEIDKYKSGSSEIAFNHDTTLLNRGYTGHEHFMGVGLIHMNGRMYDAKLGRFISPDTYVQEPFNTQNFNRFGYGFNNPLKYVDPSGEIFKWLWRQIKGVARIAWNAVKITAGLFATGPGNFLKKAWEVISRFTWQLPQTIGGFVSAQVTNLVGNVQSVDYYHGATVVRTYTEDWGGITQGSFIIGDNSIRADPNNSLFQHEYGHYLQSQKFGWAYYSRVGIPSASSKEGPPDHQFNPVEQDANMRAFKYFNKNVEGFYKSEDDKNEARGWDFRRNPLNVDGSYTRNQYVDYKNSEDLKLLDALAIKPKWFDFASWLLPVVGPIAVGFGNANYYNNQY